MILAALVVGVVIGLYLPITSNTNDTTAVVDKVEIQNIINDKIIQGGVTASVEEVVPVGNISEVKIKVQGQEDSLFVSDNGKVFYQKLVDLDEAEKAEKAAEEAKKVNVKTDKPKVELFVMSYCPYGTQMEKGYLPAVKVLGDKIDSEIKFVHYLMHGKKEGDENVLQYCIQKQYPEKFESYLGCFLDKGEEGVDSCLAANGLSKKDLNSCIVETDTKFGISKDLADESSYLSGRYPKFGIDEADAKKYGVQGSPTLVINGQKIEGAGRDSASILKTICSAFNVQPEECNSVLSPESPAPGFGYDGAGAQNSEEAGCEV